MNERGTQSFFVRWPQIVAGLLIIIVIIVVAYQFKAGKVSLSPVCGNGIVEAGEDCDPAGSLVYSSYCSGDPFGGFMGRLTCGSSCKESSTCGCYTDINKDAFVNGLDHDDFNRLYDAKDIKADCNMDGKVNSLDLSCFDGLLENGQCSYCFIDNNLDGFINGLDYDSLQGLYESKNIKADCNMDGRITSADFSCINRLFDKGLCNCQQIGACRPRQTAVLDR